MEAAGRADGSVAVVGAGIVGLCAAIHLQRAGRKVALFDALPPGNGSSFGNAGLISVDAHAPIAMPGMLRKVPGWLSDPLGPLAVRPGYALKAAPWLLRWMRAGRMDVVRAGAVALRALHRDAYDRYRDLLGPELFRDLIRQTGNVQLFGSDVPGPDERLSRGLMDEFGVEVQALGPDELRQLFPRIAPFARRGLFFPRNGYTVSPIRLTGSLADIFRAGGGAIRHERVMKLLPREAGGYRLMTSIANHDADDVVVAAGAWSKTLVAPLGIRLPLETERGYHIMLENPSIELRLPIIHKSRGLAITPMQEGLRLAGTVEIGGLDAPPNEKRARILKTHAEALFPGLTSTGERIWMGFRPSLPDSVPAIGPVPGRPGLFMAVGHGHYGMIGAAATGRLLCELMTGATPHIDAEPYSLRRFMRG